MDSILDSTRNVLISPPVLKLSRAVDQAKGLAILLVVLGHINSPLNTFIFSFHVPLFFFLAGIFIKTRYSAREYLAKGLERLVVPFLIFGAVGILVTLLKNLLFGRPIDSWGEILTGWLFWSDSTHMHHYGFVLWFLPALFWGRNIVFFAAKHLLLHPVILISASIVVAWTTAHYVSLPFGLDKGLVALPWVAMGYVFYQYHERWFALGWFGIVGVGLLFVLLVYLGGMQRLDLATKHIGNLLLSIPYTLSAILLIIGLLYRFAIVYSGYVSNMLILFGQDTMLVMVLHVYTNNAADVLINHFLGAGYWFVTFILSTAIVFFGIRMKHRYADSFVFKYL